MLEPSIWQEDGGAVARSGERNDGWDGCETALLDSKFRITERAVAGVGSQSGILHIHERFGPDED